MARFIYEIAKDIRKDWVKINPYALAYLKPMMDICTVEDNYGYDDARSICLYFLSNASGYRGQRAKELKGELKSLLGIK